MDCLEVQQLVSAALDHEVTDTARLEAAKEHCRSCAECGAFVKALVSIGRAPLPEPPADLIEKIMGTVNAEHARAERAAAAIASVRRPETPEPGPKSVRGVASAEDATSLKERLLSPRYRREVVAWSSAAAVALVAAGFGVVYGARAILTDRSAMQVIVSESGVPATEDSARGTFGNKSVPQGENGAESNALTSASPSDAGAWTDTTALIVVNGAVYQAAGPDSSVTKSALTASGSTRSALEPGGLATDHAVLGTTDPSRVFIESADGSMLAFDRVTMSFEGRTYVLQSGPLSKYGSPAVLPQGMIEPVSDDGSPVFDAAEGQTNGDIHVLRGKDASSGIALPPGARADVAEGWSWWLPVTQ